MTKTNAKKTYVIAASFLVVVSLILVTLAWLLKEDTVNNIAVSNFITNGDVYFLSGDTRTEVQEFITGGLIKVDTYNTSAVNFIGNLRFDVKHKGLSKSYLRVRLLEQWIDNKTEDIMPGDNITYDIPSDDISSWYDNRNVDLCFYYKANDGKLSTYSNKTDKENDMITIPLIKGCKDYIGVDSGVSLYITFKVETVQPNRLAEFWNIEKLPWQTT